MLAKNTVSAQEEIIRRSKKAALSQNHSGRPSTQQSEALLMRPGSSQQQARGVNQSPEETLQFSGVTGNPNPLMAKTNAFAEKYNSNSASRETKIEGRRRSQPL